MLVSFKRRLASFTVMMPSSIAAWYSVMSIANPLAQRDDVRVDAAGARAVRVTTIIRQGDILEIGQSRRHMRIRGDRLKPRDRIHRNEPVGMFVIVGIVPAKSGFGFPGNLAR